MTNIDLETFHGVELSKSDVEVLRDLENTFRITLEITDDLLFTYDFEDQWTCLEKTVDRFKVQIQNHRLIGMRITSAIETPIDLIIAPECIYNLDALVSLEIYIEGLQQFPDGFHKLNKLEKLDISCHFELLSFPAEVWKLSNLTYLDVWGIPLEAEPSEAINATKLEFLRCTPKVHKKYENRWSMLPKLNYTNY